MKCHPGTNINTEILGHTQIKVRGYIYGHKKKKKLGIHDQWTQMKHTRQKLTLEEKKVRNCIQGYTKQIENLHF